MKKGPPIWINALLLTAASVLLVLSAFAAWQGWSRGPLPAGGLVADVLVNLDGRPVREHCTTCHPDGAPYGAEGGSHPDIAPHGTEALGCTGCHLGEGMALDTRISHGLPGLGGRKVLAGKELQGRCYACHELEPLEGAERAWKGYRLFLEKACDSCHYIGSLGLGGRYGPDLSRVGSDLGLKKIREAIRSPRKEPVNSTMPRFPLSRGQAANLTYFLKSRVARPNHLTPMVSRALERRKIEAELPSSSGEKLLEEARCLACHKFREKDGRIAPDLTFIGSQRSERYLEDFLRYPAGTIPGAAMPVVPLPGAAERSLTTYLAKEARGPIQEKDAKTLYMRLCQRCHAADGGGRGLIEPNLAGFPRAFSGNEAFFRAASDERLLLSLEKGVPGTPMPPYGGLLEEGEREALLDLVFASFVGIGRGEKVEAAGLPPRPEATAAEEGDRLYRRLCLDCHGTAGTGTGPEHLEHLPRPRNLANRPYFASIEDERIARTILEGVPGTGMKSFGEDLSAEELWALIGKVRSFSETRR